MLTSININERKWYDVCKEEEEEFEPRQRKFPGWLKLHPTGMLLLENISWNVNEEPRTHALKLLPPEVSGEPPRLTHTEWNQPVFKVPPGQGIEIRLPISNFEMRKIKIRDEQGYVTIGRILSALFEYYTREYVIIQPLDIIPDLSLFNGLNIHPYGVDLQLD